jgi:hypothetical protein
VSSARRPGARSSSAAADPHRHETGGTTRPLLPPPRQQQGADRVRPLKVFLVVALGWAVLAGTLLRISGVALDSLTGAVLIAVLYMPSPMVRR